ncbi:unnamed protein product [Rotaria sp. Silwood2]|nr:unnamed protein product [Rotaria sp. Silwood2]
MPNLQELTLYIIIVDGTVFINGGDIYNEILVHMPRLHLFNFLISSHAEIDNLVYHASKDDIQQTLSNIKYQEVDCIVNYDYILVECHIFSLPFMFEDLIGIGNAFPSIIFSHVTFLQVNDKAPFEHEFFQQIAWSFPFLKQLNVLNINRQSSILTILNSNDNLLYSIVKYLYLMSLYLTHAHIDNVEQFLNETKTRLPRLTTLVVNCKDLTIITDNFTRDAMRINCINVKELNVFRKIEQSKDFCIYFPLLKPCSCSC